MHVYLSPVSRTYHERTLGRPVRHRMAPKTFSKPTQRLIPLHYLHPSLPGGLSLAVTLTNAKLTIPSCPAFSFDLVPLKMLKQITVYEGHEFRSSSPCTFLHIHVTFFVKSSWNVMAHGDPRVGKWRGNWRIEWVASTLHTTSEHGVSNITTAHAHNSAELTPHADLNGFVRFAEKRNLVSARVSSHFKRRLLLPSTLLCILQHTPTTRVVPCVIDQVWCPHIWCTYNSLCLTK